MDAKIPADPRPSELRYHKELSIIDGCPGPVTVCQGVGFRSVHEDLSHPHNFAPTAVIDPERLARAVSCKQRCSLWGLSMYESVDQLSNMIRRVEKTAKNFRTLVGAYYVELKLEPIHGRRSKSTKGHFDLHPSVDFDGKDCVRKHELLTL